MIMTGANAGNNAAYLATNEFISLIQVSTAFVQSMTKKAETSSIGRQLFSATGPKSAAGSIVGERLLFRTCDHVSLGELSSQPCKAL